MAAILESAAPPTRSELGEWWRTVDRWSLTAALMLLLIGLVLGMATSAALADRTGMLDPFFYLRRHVFYVVVALVLMFACAQLSRRSVRRVGVAMFLIGLGLLVAVLIMGENRGGATRWLSILGVSMQPSELLKPGLIAASAWMFSIREQPGAPPGGMIAAGLMGLVACLLILQPDYGQTALMSSVWGVMFFVAGASMIWAVSGFLIITLVAIAAYLTSSHFARRVDLFFSPDGAGDQIRLTWAAIQNGGLWGRGPGEGVHKSSLPDAHSDFVIAVAAEEYGLALTLIILALFAFISIRAILRLADDPDDFARIAGTGYAALLAIQAMIHVGVSARVLPTKGMTLPFLSYGGSSLIACGIAMGFLLALTRREPDER